MTPSSSTITRYDTGSNGCNSETRNSDISTIHSPPLGSNHSTSTYVWSTENISRLLEGWMRSSPRANLKPAQDEQYQRIRPFDDSSSNGINQAYVREEELRSDQECCDPISQAYMKWEQVKNDQECYCGPIPHRKLESFFSVENSSHGNAWEKSSVDSTFYRPPQSTLADAEANQRLDSQQHIPLSLLETWLLDETELSADRCSDAMLQ